MLPVRISNQLMIQLRHSFHFSFYSSGNLKLKQKNRFPVSVTQSNIDIHKHAHIQAPLDALGNSNRPKRDHE